MLHILAPTESIKHADGIWRQTDSSGNTRGRGGHMKWTLWSGEQGRSDERGLQFHYGVEIGSQRLRFSRWWSCRQPVFGARRSWTSAEWRIGRVVVLTVLTAGGKRVSAATPKAVYTQEEPRGLPEREARERSLLSRRCSVTISIPIHALRIAQGAHGETDRQRERERERRREWSRDTVCWISSIVNVVIECFIVRWFARQSSMAREQQRERERESENDRGEERNEAGEIHGATRGRRCVYSACDTTCCHSAKRVYRCRAGWNFCRRFSSVIGPPMEILARAFVARETRTSEWRSETTM